MNIALNVSEYDGGRVYSLSTDKTAMTITVSDRCGYVQTCVDNASARSNRFGVGKVFHGPGALDAAIGAYKSGVCKAMLETVQHEEAARCAS
jgi:hypothetical protein